MPGTFNPMIVTDLFSEQSAPWEDIARNHIDKVFHKTMKDYMEHTQRELHNKHGNRYQCAKAVPHQLRGQVILFASRPTRLPAPIRGFQGKDRVMTSSISLSDDARLSTVPRTSSPRCLFVTRAHERGSLTRPITTTLGLRRTMDTLVTLPRVTRKSTLSAAALSTTSTRCPASLNLKRQ